VEAIIEEMQLRYAQGYRVFDFEDDNLTFDRVAMGQLCEQIIAVFPAGDLQLLAMNGLSYVSLDTELLLLMKQAGFSHLNLSLVSANADVMRQVSRPHALGHYLDIVHEGAKLGFQMVVYQILGLPQESLDSMIDTLVLNAGLPVLLGASPFYVPPNSAIATIFPPPSEQELFTARLTALARDTAVFSRDDIFTLFVATRILNFFKGLYLPASEMALSEVLIHAEQQGGRTALGAMLFSRLYDEHILYAASGTTFKPVPRFKADLFFQFWSCLPYLTTQTGNRISKL
jgi:hypothetical protein